MSVFRQLRPIVVHSPALVKAWEFLMKPLRTTTSRGLAGVALFPFIIVKEKKPSLLVHEATHFYQAIEMFVVGFYVYYACYWLIHLFSNGFDARQAYLDIPFEQEARHSSSIYMDIDQLRRYRAWYEWTQYQD